MAGIDIGKIILATSQEDLAKVEKKYGSAPLQDVNQFLGFASLISNGKDIVHLVYLDIEEYLHSKKGFDNEGLLTLVHESVHVVQHYLETVGEDKPGKEIEAYLVESVFRELSKQLKRKLKKWKKRKVN